MKLTLRNRLLASSLLIGAAAFAQPAWAQLPAPHSDAEWVDIFRERWLETVAEQMVADVEVGAFLSGGVDSSAVVAAMTRIADRPVRTFTIGFPDPRYDESGPAEAIAAASVTRTISRARSVSIVGPPESISGSGGRAMGDGWAGRRDGGRAGPAGR